MVHEEYQLFPTNLGGFEYNGVDGRGDVGLVSKLAIGL
jgi:hypothetical protein